MAQSPIIARSIACSVKACQVGRVGGKNGYGNLAGDSVPRVVFTQAGEEGARVETLREV